MKTLAFVIFLMSCSTFSLAATEDAKTRVYYGMESFLRDVANPADQNALPKTYRLLLPKIELPIEFVYAPFKRILRHLVDDEPACHYYALENGERKNQFLFSLPMTFLPSPRVYTRVPVDQRMLNERGEIKSLTNTVQAQPGGVILLTESISYGDELDAFIEQIPARNIVWRASGDRHNKVSEMFFKDRTQMALVYPQEAQQYLASQQEDEKPFFSYGIEGVPAIMGGKLMCNKFTQNDAFLKAFNQGILALYEDKDYIATQQRHTPDELRQSLHEAIMHAKTSFEQNQTLSSAAVGD
ncbi:hypothetical protein [Alteromonas ponticola]|uniref:ABC transporter substrate-binding protein n=1 Tax=Alteromonas ponticola TaxID=2720613 RepID=A0ABX1R4N4_9ALTE|nr:hypothetical protein [Alteromonas ponticola]NMH60866.1 hypothetical protein [Alteromonas ponticola]